MAEKKIDQDKADEAPAKKAAARIKNAREIGGVWFADDGTPLADGEIRQAIRQQDAARMAAREKARGA